MSLRLRAAPHARLGRPGGDRARRATWPRAATRGCARRSTCRAADADPGGEGLGAARPRRRGVPHRHEVVVRAAGHRQAHLRHGELRRVRARARATTASWSSASRTALIEGTAIAAHAIGCHTAFIYIRGEYLWQGIVLQRALEEAYAGRLPGQGHRWAATTTWTSCCTAAPAPTSAARRRRCSTRWRACAASRACARRSRRWRACTRRPTVINNVETLMNVPDIVANGADWFRALGTEKSPGTKMFTISGKVERPGNYEIPMGTPFRVLLEELGGGVLGGRDAQGVHAGRLVHAAAHRRRTSTCTSTTSRSPRPARCWAPAR